MTQESGWINKIICKVRWTLKIRTWRHRRAWLSWIRETSTGDSLNADMVWNRFWWNRICFNMDSHREPSMSIVALLFLSFWTKFSIERSALQIKKDGRSTPNLAQAFQWHLAAVMRSRKLAEQAGDRMRQWAGIKMSLDRPVIESS